MRFPRERVGPFTTQIFDGPTSTSAEREWVLPLDDVVNKWEGTQEPVKVTVLFSQQQAAKEVLGIDLVDLDTETRLGDSNFNLSFQLPRPGGRRRFWKRFIVTLKRKRGLYEVKSIKAPMGAVVSINEKKGAITYQTFGGRSVRFSVSLGFRDMAEIDVRSGIIWLVSGVILGLIIELLKDWVLRLWSAPPNSLNLDHIHQERYLEV